MFDRKTFTTGIFALGLGLAAAGAAPAPFNPGDPTTPRWATPVPDSTQPATTFPREPDANYTPETDPEVRRAALPGENPLHTLKRLADQEKTTRLVSGTAMVISGPVLALAGFIGLAAEDVFGDYGAGPELLFGGGLVMTGAGLYLLTSPWSAERRYDLSREKVMLGIRPDGRGIRVTVRF